MITQALIDAESITPALTEGQVMVLSMLVKRYPPYYNAVGLYPALADRLAGEVAVPTIKTKALKAVLTFLGEVPSFVVESQGSADSRSFFSTKENWNESAQDVLDILYEVPIVQGNQNFAVAQRPTHKIALNDRVILREDETGRRY